MTHARPDPDALLAAVQQQQDASRRGRLKVWLGAAPGVGKTFAMLSTARRLRTQGRDVVVGVVETHGRAETERLLAGLEQLPRRAIDYRGTLLREFDLAGALARHPALLLVDELAHTNAPGSRCEKRWQDVRALLQAGIDVHTTLNVQHLESLNDVVASVTGVRVRETVPDAILAEADEVELVDLAPDVLLERLAAGKVYRSETVRAAGDGFFRKGNLIALRELALRQTAQWVERRGQEYRRAHDTRARHGASERVLVCVGPSPLSARLVRAAHRMAAVVGAELFALYVESPRARLRRTAADRERVLQNLRLAESLGARTATIDARDAAGAVVAFARQHAIGRLVVGKSGRGRLAEALFGSFTAEVIRASQDLDVYVIRAPSDDAPAPDAGDATPASHAPPHAHWKAYGMALLHTALALGVAAALYRAPDLSAEAMVLLLGVVVTAWRCGRWPAVGAATASVVAFNFLFVEPRYTFAVHDASYLVAFAVLLAVGLITSSLVAEVREQAETAGEREREASALYSLSRALGDAADTVAIGNAVTNHLRDVLPCAACVLVPASPHHLDAESVVATHGDTAWLTDDAFAVARWSWEHGKVAGDGTGNLPGARALFVPMVSGSGKEGVIAVRRSTSAEWTAKQRLLVAALGSLTARALERERLLADKQRAERDAEIERLRSTLLASVSHDLRTPLATILGAASNLAHDATTLDADARAGLAQSIVDEAERLHELIANLLSATRLEAGELAVRRDWVSVEEVVGSALRRARPRLAGHTVHCALPADLPLLRGDAVLLEQAIYNLLDNAGRHTPAGTTVTVDAGVHGARLALEVRDGGPGVGADDARRLFDRFAPGSRSSGTGLGLAICASIAKAHGGEAEVETAPGRGCRFRLWLPLPSHAPAVPQEDAG